MPTNRSVSNPGRWPRTSAALGFGAAGMALSALWWSPVILQARNVLPFVLFIGVPGISAGIAGLLLGKPLMNSARIRSGKVAALRGVAIASFALLLFAPLFASMYVLTAPANEHWNVAGLALILLIGSAVAVWWIVALIGAAVGWMLFRVGSQDRGM